MKQKSKSNWLLWVLLIFIPPVGIIYMWITQKELSQNKKKTLSIIFTVWFVLCIVIGGNQSDTDDTPIEDNNVATNTNNEIENDNFADTDNIQQDIDVKKKDKPSVDNFLINSDLEEGDVMNGFGDTVIGKYAFISITNKQFKKITPDMLKEFAETIVKDSGYNWVSITTPSNIGICFTGSETSTVPQGKLDNDGGIVEAYGYWTFDYDNDNYIYKKAEEE